MVRRTGLGSLGTNKNYYQYNYIDVIQKIVPSMYQDTDSTIFGEEEDVLYSTLGKIILAAKDCTTLIPISNTLPAYTLSGIRGHFIPKNELTNIQPYLFENKILRAFGKSLSDFKSSSDWETYVSGTLLPSIPLNNPTTSFVSGVSANINAAVSSTGAAHQYLIDNLSWLYLLNFPGPTAGFAASTISQNLLVSSTYLGKSIEERDGVKGLFEYIWRNKEVQTASGMRYIPPIFNQASSTTSANIYASGTQLLDGLKTLIDVWYNPNDEAATELQTQLELLISLGTYNSKRITAGPFQRFLKALSFATYDVNSLVDDIGSLVDVQRCDKRFLNYLGALIGWKVLTGDVDRWRGQLRQAVYLYKAKGTRKALETAVSLMFPDAGFNASESTEEVWESYIPRLIYYLIATESKVLNDPLYNPPDYDSGVAGATTVSVNGKNIITNIDGAALFDEDDHDNNYRFATDYVLSALQGETNAIKINGVPYHSSSWDPNGNGEVFKGFEHRGKLVPVPPWENDRFYDTTYMTDNQLSYLSGLLPKGRADGGLEIPLEYVKGFTRHVHDKCLNSPLINGLNFRWKFFTSSVELPPNLDSVVTGTRAQDISLKDYWNSKASTLLTTIETSALTQKLNAGTSGTTNYANYPQSDFYYGANTDEVIYVLSEIFRQFIPFHSVVKFYATQNMTDRVNLTGSGTSDGIRYSVLVEYSDNDDQILRDFILSGCVASSVSGVESPSSIRRLYTSVPRTSRRRRNLKYIVPAAAYYRDGRSMPIARGQCPSSTLNPGYVSSVVEYDNNTWAKLIFSGTSNQMNVSSFIPLGFNFSTGNYFSPKGPDGWIYDQKYDLGLSALPVEWAANSRADKADVTTVFYGIDVSSTYPCRALGNVNLSSNYMLGAETRRAMDYSTCAVYATVLNAQKTKDLVKSLAPSSIENVAFGILFWDLWNKHQRYFNGLNFNYRYDALSASGAYQRFMRAGGRSMGAQLEGPGFFNSDFAVQGNLPAGNFNSASAIEESPDLIYSFPQWKYIAYKPAAQDLEYMDANGTSKIKINKTSPFKGTSQKSRLRFPDYLDTVTGKCVINSMVSGVSLVAGVDTERPAWAVYNTAQYGVENTSSNATNEFSDYVGNITLFNEMGSANNPLLDKSHSVQIRYSLNQGREYIPNPEFRWKAALERSIAGGSTEATPWANNLACNGIAGFALQASNTTTRAGSPWYTGTLGFPAFDTSSSVGYFLSGLNPDTDQYIVSANCSGNPAWRHPKSSWIKVNDSDTYGGDAATLMGLIPGRKYRLTVDFMTHHTTASGVGVNLSWVSPVPGAKSAQLNRAGGWSKGGMAFNQIMPVLAPGPNPGSFNTSTLDFEVSSVFMPGDAFELSLVPVGAGSSGKPSTKEFVQYFFKKIKMEELDDSPTKNRLLPEKDYRLSVRFKEGTAPKDNEGTIAVRIRTDNIPVLYKNTQNGYDSTYSDSIGKGNSFAFDQADGKWKNILEDDYEYSNPATSHTGLNNLYYEYQVSDVPMDPDPAFEAEGWRMLEIPFSTKNSNLHSPDQWLNYSIREYQKFIYKSGKPLHNLDTVYHVEIGKFSADPVDTEPVDRTSITVDKVAFQLVDSYDELLNFYPFEALERLFYRFDLQTSGDSSRNSYFSASSYQTSGGSRISYQEKFGGNFSGVEDESYKYADASGGVIYNILDD